MHDWQSLSHVRWECKCHVVIVAKYRQKVFYGQMRRRIGVILRERCRQRGVELIEGRASADHIHMCLRIGDVLLTHRSREVIRALVNQR